MELLEILLLVNISHMKHDVQYDLKITKKTIDHDCCRDIGEGGKEMQRFSFRE